MSQPELPTAWKQFANEPEPGQKAPPLAKSLVSKLAEVMAAVERLPKHGHNNHFDYDFVTESDITAAIRTSMAERHLMMVPDVQAISWRDIATRSGVSQVCCLMVRFTVHDGETGETISFVVPGEGQDSGDKAVPKAMTSALKYACLKLFMIPTGDDPEYDGGRKGQRERRPAVTVLNPGQAHPGEPVAFTQVTSDIPPSAIATIPEGCALVLQAQAGSWGKAIGEIVLVEHGGTEAKYAVFDKQVLADYQAACRDKVLVTPDYASPKRGGKVYLRGVRREESPL